MANLEQFELLNSGVEAWNAWRKEHLEVAVDLRGATLVTANLIDANLESTNLRGATLFGADLSGANLIDANFIDANLFDANLFGANLIGANLHGANLSRANLSRANLESAAIGITTIGNVDLSVAYGLSETLHQFPSTVGTDTLELTAAGFGKAPPGRQAEVEAFLRSAGVTEHFIEYFRGLIGCPIEFYSAFISYSHADKLFAQRLYNDLQGKGIRCWLDEHHMKPGDPMREVINQAIRLRDRVLLCCSRASLTSDWVNDELAITFEKEGKEKRSILIPLDLDGYLFDGWDSGKGARVRERLAADFQRWDQDAAHYQAQFERVVKALRPEPAATG